MWIRFDEELQHRVLVVKNWLEATQSQLTVHGICELQASLADGELGVFFRNNHFSTITKRNGELYILATDLGFADTSVHPSVGHMQRRCMRIHMLRWKVSVLYNTHIFGMVEVQLCLRALP